MDTKETKSFLSQMQAAYIIKRAIDRIEQQEQRIAELEAENRDIRQNSVSYTTHAEFVSDYQEQIDERDARIAELERELAAAKEDITSIVKQGVEDFEKRAWTPPCRFCVKFEECDFIPTDGEKVYLDENGYTHGDAYCSGRGEHLDGSDEFAMPGRWCPKCGADMRGEKKSD